MKALCLGQRWISQAEPELGLGTLVDITHRTISIYFDASDCTRQYVLKSAPIQRIIFKPGDTIQLKDKTSLVVNTVFESEGLMFYSGSSDNHSAVCETQLCDTISFSEPQNRLFAGITDTNKLFNLRYQIQTSKAGYDSSLAKGFLGGQVELIPHQFYIADTVTSRYIPRVLLSDETGLGKTIEACLILHKLLITSRAKRVLIIVPESLTHQWFIELYRKFNLSFMIINEAFCQDLKLSDPDLNPFSEYQLGIISTNTLDSAKKRSQIIAAGWDMVVIDEAHHLTDHSGIYEFVLKLSKNVFGMMLLTATPEQMGVKNHFLHLQLLDPERYFDFDVYQLETNQYQATIQTVKEMIQKNEPIDHILDSYGPGRVIFRNKRNVVKGFPKRVAHLIALSGTASQIERNNLEFFENQKIMLDEFNQDPRIVFLVKWIKGQIKNQTKSPTEKRSKILVICRSKEKAIAIEHAIYKHISVDVVRFDETMSLLQRDKNAAWFANETGAQVLICSEIGSEGRNFQFVHNLFLFDLPLNPELLEQRIGRIDRIGQKNDVHIHVPFVLGSAYEVLAKWFMHGLNLFECNIDGVHLIYNQFEKPLTDLLECCKNGCDVKEEDLNDLIEKTGVFCRDINETLTRGKNILLEMNSFKVHEAQIIIDEVTRMDQESELEQILIHALDHYGIETDDIDKTIFKLQTNQIMDTKLPSFSRMTDAMTFSRKTAVIRDDIDFLSWDHSFVQQTIEYFITNATGSCSTVVLKTGHPGVWLETVYILECVAPQYLNLERYLQAQPIRIVLDHEGRDITSNHSFKSLMGKLDQDHGNWFKDLEQVRQVLIPTLIQKSQNIAQDQSQPLIQRGIAKIKSMVGKEIKRLKQLKKVNPDIKEDEIVLAKKQMKTLLEHLSTARVRLDALRLIRLE